ncbi:flavin-containing monooxygenase [Rhodococcus koreensis]
MSTVTPDQAVPVAESVQAEYEVAVIGAGFLGMYALHRQLTRKVNVICFEAGEGVGGTWYWNRYPGARVDIESMQYSYSFDEELQQEWSWPEHFSAQPDLEAYANHVADRFGLREHIEFGARVTQLRFDQAENRWHLRTELGHHVTARYVIAACGSLHATNVPDFPGLERFEGQWFHTSAWPQDAVSFQDKRVGIIGTGSTGVQMIPVIAETAGELFVFQRTPAYSMPSGNRPLDPDYERAWKVEYPERRREMFTSPSAGIFVPPKYSVLGLSAEERERVLNERWNSRCGVLFLNSFTDVGTNPEANEIVAEFVRNKIRETVKDPEIAKMLCPATYPIGAKRICMDSGYYETFNRKNVTLVDVRRNPLTEVTPAGLRTTVAEYELDILIFATGFDAVTGSLERMNITGVGGRDLRDKWRDGSTNYLGFLVAGFPNLFMIHGPGSPGVLAQMITGGEWQVDFVTRFIEDMKKAGRERVDTTEEWEVSWSCEVNAAADKKLYKFADSWYTGANITGKPRIFMIWAGGFDRYTQRCREQVEANYQGFVFGP